MLLNLQNNKAWNDQQWSPSSAWWTRTVWEKTTRWIFWYTRGTRRRHHLFDLECDQESGYFHTCTKTNNSKTTYSWPEVKLVKSHKILQRNPETKQVSINDDLNKRRDELLFLRRQLCRKKLILQAWSSNGKIRIRDNRLKTYIIGQESDLVPFGHTQLSCKSWPSLSLSLSLSLSVSLSLSLSLSLQDAPHSCDIIKVFRNS